MALAVLVEFVAACEGFGAVLALVTFLKLEFMKVGNKEFNKFSRYVGSRSKLFLCSRIRIFCYSPFVRELDFFTLTFCVTTSSFT